MNPQRPHDDDPPTVSLGDTPPAQPELLGHGDRVGRFSVLDRAGAGGMGVVYAAYDPELDRRVAVKLLTYDRGRPREANLRLLREAQAMARLSHPNVVSVYDVGELDGRAVFLAMEYVEGQTLDRWLAAERRDWQTIVDVLVQAGRGLAAAHQAGLVHRDFKPGNVLVDRGGRARVTDFGIARLTDEPEQALGAAPDEAPPDTTPLAISLTRTGAAVGTPAYMAPEQHRSQAIDARADQFAFCVTAWEALYGERPFGGAGSELIVAITDGAIRQPSDDRGTPGWIAPLLRRGLAAAPDARWPAMEPLLDRLADDRATRRRRRLVIAALLLVAVAAGGVGLLSRPASAPAPAATCEADDELAGIWDTETRGAGQAAFLATGSPLAGDNWAAVERIVGAWADRWERARTGACRAHARGEQSDELYDRRIICLQRGKNRLGALASLLRAPDAPLVRESPLAAAALPPPEDCADVEALLSDAPPPADPIIRSAVAALRTRVDTGDTLNTAGRYADAITTLEAALAGAGEIDHPPLRAQVLYGLGVAYMDGGKPVPAEETLRRAADAAAAARDVRLYANSLIRLLWVVGGMQARYEDAAPLRVFATQAVHLADSPELLGHLHHNSGGVDYMHGDYQVALPQLERALALKEQVFRADDVKLVSTLNLIGATYNVLDRHDEADRAYQRALHILETTVSPRHPRVAGLLNNLGNNASARRKWEDAEGYYRRALAISEATLGPEDTGTAQVLMGLSGPLQERHRYDEASALVGRALTILEKNVGPDHPYVAAALAILGGMRREEKRCAEALPYLDRSLSILAKKFKDDSPKMASPLQSKGGCLVDLGRPQEGLPLLERALRIEEAEQIPVDLAESRFELARALWAANRDRPRALTLAGQAKDAFTAAAIDSEVATIDAWLLGKDK